MISWRILLERRYGAKELGIRALKNFVTCVYNEKICTVINERVAI